ncbi:MAG: single-stranded-DNA-specific exonuclease RecJ [Clostridia bacterium]|nr:single-stranded-DNA-specific exonuclease RecJ [Clostridia bacterium]
MQQFVSKTKTVSLPEEIEAIDAPRKLLELLYDRGWQTREALGKYLNPEKTDVYDPFLMQDMDKAVAVILDAMDKKEHITVFGDYDVDGVTATAILVTWLRKQRAQVDYYIPDRHGEGYGLNVNAVEEIAKRSQLLITVDCGITSTKETARAKELGMRVIITDHHQLGAELPECEAVLNPLLGEYPFRYLCGAGVAFKLVHALGGTEAIEGLWDLAALATVADIVPLRDENRVIVHYGLRAMVETRRPGLKALFDISNVQGTPTSSDIAFKLAPRINAGGRLALASQSVELLTTRNEGKAREIAERLNGFNDKRKELEAGIFQEAIQAVTETVDFTKDKVIIVCGKDWELGVVGLVASRLVERYHWPAIVLSKNAEEICVGSVRSIPGINIFEVLSQCSDLFVRFGGHAQAAGVTIAYANLPALRERVNEVIEKSIDKTVYIPTAEYDLEVSPEEITDDFVQAFNVMQPVGFGNPAPIFYLPAQKITDVRTLGKEGLHLRMSIGNENNPFSGIWYRRGNLVSEIPEMADILASLQINVWREQRSIQCEISTLEPTFPQKHFRKLCEGYTDAIDYSLLKAIHAPKMPSAPCTYTVADETAFMTSYNQILRENIQGTLIVFHSIPGLYANWAVLSLLLKDANVDFSFVTLGDPRGFNTVIMAPDWRSMHTSYERILIMDEFFYKGEAEEIRNQFKDAEIVLFKNAKSGRKKWIESVASNKDQLRDFIKLFKKEQNNQNLENLSLLSGRKKGSIFAALIGFEQLNLLNLSFEPFSYTLKENKKVNLNDSPLFRSFGILDQ